MGALYRPSDPSGPRCAAGPERGGPEHAIGGQARSRIGDPCIFSAVLYQLSYLADREAKWNYGIWDRASSIPIAPHQWPAGRGGAGQTRVLITSATRRAFA